MSMVKDAAAMKPVPIALCRQLPGAPGLAFGLPRIRQAVVDALESADTESIIDDGNSSFNCSDPWHGRT
jgi:hypothetical protein